MMSLSELTSLSSETLTTSYVVLETTVQQLPSLEPPLKTVEDSTWWMVVGIVSGIMFPLFIIWLFIKIVDIRRDGLSIDYFYERVKWLDVKSATNINYLYNKAELGIQYKEKGNLSHSTSSSRLHKTVSTFQRKTKKVSASLMEKFDLKRHKKRKFKNHSDQELHPIKVNKTNNNKKTPSTDLTFNGKTVKVALKKMEVGRARPLPPLPVT